MSKYLSSVLRFHLAYVHIDNMQKNHSTRFIYHMSEEALDYMFSRNFVPAILKCVCGCEEEFPVDVQVRSQEGIRASFIAFPMEEHNIKLIIYPDRKAAIAAAKKKRQQRV